MSDSFPQPPQSRREFIKFTLLSAAAFTALPATLALGAQNQPQSKPTSDGQCGVMHDCFGGGPNGKCGVMYDCAGGGSDGKCGVMYNCFGGGPNGKCGVMHDCAGGS